MLWIHGNLSDQSRPQGATEVVVEPLLRDVVEFSTLVLGTEDGPVASLPLEIKLQDPDEMFVDAEMEVSRFLTRVKVRLTAPNCTQAGLVYILFFW